MEQSQTHNAVHRKHLWILSAVVVLLIGGAFAFTLYKISTLNEQVVSLSNNLSSTTAMLYGTTGALSKNISDLNSQAEGISQALSTTKEDVAAVSSNVSGVQQTVGSISGTVSTLQKLSTIDPEILKKYSKVYFLNENYAPAHLATVMQDFVYSNTRQEQFMTEALPYLQRMLAAAKTNGVTFYVFSAYRSFAKQQTLKSAYTVTYGAGTASAFSADQGYSEHQLGTTVDFIKPGFGGELTTKFDGTDAFIWLQHNAHLYGFTLSYPKDNTYYVYEPWHWRFVGVKLATYLHDHNMHFYDMDQRDIDTYLATIFD